MNKLFCLIALGWAGVLPAEQIVVFAKGETPVLSPDAAAPAPAVPARAQFLSAYRADLSNPAAFKDPFVLSAPPEWGRTVSGAEGSIQFHPSFRGGFVVQVGLSGLSPHHRYILCLNGNPKLAGNERLVDVVPGNDAERYFDFFTATTDQKGNYQATFGIMLPGGPYHVRFYVKDTDDFKIVLYHDYFKFNVE